MCESIPVAHVIVIIAMIMSPNNARPARREKRPVPWRWPRRLDHPAQHGEEASGVQVRGLREVDGSTMNAESVEPSKELSPAVVEEDPREHDAGDEERLVRGSSEAPPVFTTEASRISMSAGVARPKRSPGNHFPTRVPTVGACQSSRWVGDPGRRSPAPPRWFTKGRLERARIGRNGPTNWTRRTEKWRSHGLLLDDERATGQPGVGPNGSSVGKTARWNI